jgi:exosortase D (VPLPA-CTERM-specific)
MMKAFQEIRLKPASWVKAGFYACAVVLVYYSALKQLIINDWSREDYSHSIFVPFVVLYLIWGKRAALTRLPSAPSWHGMTPFFIGIFLFWLGELGGEYFTLYLSLWFVIVGLAWIHLGWEKMRMLVFPFVMMLAMFPLPNFVHIRITSQLKLVSSQFGVWMLQTIGMPAYREGNIIDLGFTQLQVVDACSGLRYVVPLMVLGVLLAYWFKAHWWKKAALFLSSMPLSIFMNSVRIALTGVLYSAFGAKVAEDFFHGFSGWLIFMSAFPVFLAEMWVLKKLPPREQQNRTALAMPGDAASAGETTNIEKQGGEGRLVMKTMQPQFVASFLVLLLCAGISQSVEFRQKIPISKPLDQFPMQVGEWKGSPEAMDRKFRDFLNFSDYIMANYVDSRGKTVNFYVAYYQDQRKGESIHSPETCMPMGGWTFCDAGGAAISLADGKSTMLVNRAFIEKDGVRQLTYYWFPQRGRILTKLYQLKIYSFLDSLIKQRTDGALVRVVTPVYDSEQMQDAEQRLQSFTRRIVPVLDGFIPGKDLL